MTNSVLPRAPSGRRIRRRLATALTVAALAGTALAAPVSAAPQSATVDETLHTGPTSIGSKSYDIDVFGTLTVSATAELSQPVRETLDWDDANLRQGRSIDVARAVATNGPGTLTVKFSATGIGPPINQTVNASCTMSFTSPVTCNAESGSIRIVGAIPGSGPIVDLKLVAEVTVSPTDATLDSTIQSGGITIAGPSTQTLPTTQTVDIPCSAGVGDTLSLSDTGIALAGTITGSNGPAIEIGAWIPNPIPPFIPPFIPFGFATFNVGTHASGSLGGLADPDTHGTDLGAVKANNIPPSVVVPASFSGVEGSPIHFSSAGTTALCGPPALRWDFSDGGVAFGASPFHTFADDGIFSGLLTATDTTGLSSSKTFSIIVGNQNPVVNAGPDTTADWGRLVAFNGQATDPGAGDQSTLQYTWDFGDGTPTASGSSGSGVFHAYASPGLLGYYDAVLTVSDKDGGSSSDTRRVYVTKRDTTTSYLGASAGTYDTPETLRASVVDEYGADLNAKTIDFSVDLDPAGSATTNSTGIATRAYTPLVNAGAHTTTASFAGDALYNASNGGGTLAIARKATSMTYTGALNGGPNKTVGLSAILADATGTRLAGRTIVFVLGAQTTSAVTDGNGVAITTLQLNQKNAIYPLTATFTPAGGDVPHYLGSTDAKSFNLQKK